MTIKRFEDIEGWQMARNLCQEIFRISSQTTLDRDYGLKDQMSGSSGSIMDNIAEGFDSGTNPEFIRFLQYSKRSCSELQSQLYRCLDRGHITVETFDPLYASAASTRGKIGAFIQYLSSNPRPVSTMKARHAQKPRTENREL
ncbi:four helix bundle protein [Brevifollis gellanilyticus]|uniref:Four helix bundle protein n=1 Tax=Brevifollis gellanilyticus TaxID=748831 RepID=A0A512M7C3_9BACT|nr:four helix bundle protein [Brevifollis gellanilyticus]GEP42635.1 four helix bundle protein [Brevifollis gellanilyticus]